MNTNFVQKVNFRIFDLNCNIGGNLIVKIEQN